MSRTCCILIAIILGLPGISFAQSPDALSRIRTLIEYKHFDDALTFAQKAAVDNQGEPTLAFLVAEIYYGKGKYDLAIENYINLMNGLTADTADALMLREIHRHLADAYHQIGQRKRFTKELSLRIVHETEQFLERAPEQAQDERFVNFLRQSIGKYDMAGTDTAVDTEEGHLGEKDLQLPEDYTDSDVKLRYHRKAVQRVKAFDAEKARAGSVTPG